MEKSFLLLVFLHCHHKPTKALTRKGVYLVSVCPSVGAYMKETSLERRYPDPASRQFDEKSMRRSVYSIQKALHEDFHEYWLERCIVTIEWEKNNNITHAAKRRRKTPASRQPKRPSETDIDPETRKRSRTAQKQERETKLNTIITNAMSFVNRKPSEHPHSQFILDRSRKTVTRKFKTAKSSLPTPENDED
jgi:hypothetical protein